MTTLTAMSSPRFGSSTTTVKIGVWPSATSNCPTYGLVYLELTTSGSFPASGSNGYWTGKGQPVFVVVVIIKIAKNLATFTTRWVLVMAVMGLVHSPYGVLAFPAAILIGFAFGAVGTAATTYMRTWQDLDLVTLVTLPLFLFSATFYPIDVYPEFIQIVTWISPLYHGVILIRGLTLGILEWTMLVNVAYLTAMGAVGSWVTGRRIGQLLLK